MVGQQAAAVGDRAFEQFAELLVVARSADAVGVL